MPSVKVMINGKAYRIGHEEGEEQRILALAAEVEGKIDAFKGAHRELGDLHVLVMAAIALADERDEARGKASDLERQIKVLRQQDAAVSERHDAADAELAAAIAGAAQHITDIARRLNAD